MNMDVNGDNFQLSMVRAAFKKARHKNGLRKWARTYAQGNYDYCLKARIPGNLHRKIQRLCPEIEQSMQNQVWMSDFYATYEPCPVEIRKAIQKTFEQNKPNRKQNQNKTGK